MVEVVRDRNCLEDITFQEIRDAFQPNLVRIVDVTYENDLLYV